MLPYCPLLVLTTGLTFTKSALFLQHNSRMHFYCIYNRLLDSLVVERWHQVRELPGSIPSQGPRHTKDVIKMVPGSSLV